jgi:hypothetical protein
MGINHVSNPEDYSLMAADAKFVNWFLYLPKCKTEIVREDRSVDEIMFRAHLTINT